MPFQTHTETPSTKFSTDAAYREAIAFASSHYENFPVVSFLLPRKLKKDVAVIYWFARTADDIADEGNAGIEERLQKLNHFEQRLTELLNGFPANALEYALAETIHNNKLTSDLFYDLLSAFKQDAAKTNFETFNDILFYCKHSANPVGRLILELFKIRDEEAFFYSDKICTALQLTNFYQDAQLDFQRGRVYFPLEEIKQFDVDQNLVVLNENYSNLMKMVEHNVNRAQSFFDEGKNILHFLKGRLKFEIKWTIYGGEAILEKIRKNNYNIFAARPVLSKRSMISLLFKSLL